MNFISKAVWRMRLWMPCNRELRDLLHAQL